MADQPGCILLPAGQLQESSAVNWMPFGIAFDGSVSTASQYFNPEVQQQDNPSTSSNNNSSSQLYTAHFRGRQLKGVCKALPDGFQGLLLKPTGNSSSVSDIEQHSWQAISSFKELRLWGHDAAPAATDPLMRSIDWLALADQMHQPIAPSAVDEELKKMEHQAVR